ncbi:hypothetical protein PPTG_21441 [Phytophthora nicotianae INRA-310]|uniref:Uncharacterized protein n=1 Tax=Phytophthora nicotianae (strain INRA-310) TaxID=761204 RepID=W2R1B8_PHYN3|nr:hypothetical protein PPTG_21441 [Phytophthora nicotianae INRA-310]ETN19237.1 hypothetical protein PPTG_21441 [Phytophthora nicotianae INRA-310]
MPGYFFPSLKKCFPAHCPDPSRANRSMTAPL